MRNLSSLWLSIFTLSLMSGLSAQNLVPNPSFEEHSQCPEFLGAVRPYNVNHRYGIVDHWLANPGDCTPDYYHPCGKRKFKVPKNICGQQEAFDGEAYIGMILRIGAVSVGNIQDLLYREHVSSRLKEDLKANYLYRVSFWLVLSEYSNYAIAGIGAYFSELPEVIRLDRAYSPQVVLNDKILIERNKWYPIIDTFQAKGGERFITLGNFDSYRARKMKKITSSTEFIKKFNYNRAYYYLDMVSVEEIGPAPPVPDKPDPLEDMLSIDSEFGLIEPGKAVILPKIEFAFDQSVLLPASIPQLNRFLLLLKEHPEWQVEIIGHTDSIGTEEKNQKLSEARAQRVIDYLEQKGIKAGRLQARGAGESQAIYSNALASGRQRNRRVEFVVLKKEP